jgi:hypothetical protein
MSLIHSDPEINMSLVHITEQNLVREGYSIYWADFVDFQDKRDV